MAITKLLTSNFKTQMARLFVRSFKRSTISTKLYLDVLRYVQLGYTDPSNYASEIINTASNNSITIPDTTKYYVFAGNSTIGTQTLNGVTCVDTSVYGSQYNIYDNMLFGKKVNEDDVSLMIDRNEWTINTVYDMYDDKDVLLSQKKFFVSVKEGGQWHVFKCIDNNNSAPSLYSPSPSGLVDSTSLPTILATTSSISADHFYQTNDGYVWMYMYSIPNVVYDKFATSGFIPLTSSYTATPPYVGSIETIVVKTKGANYLYTTGIINTTNLNPTNTKFYVTPTTTSVFEVTNAYKDYGMYCEKTGEVKKIVSSGTEKIVVNGSDTYVSYIEIESPFARQIATGITCEISPYVQITDMSGGTQAAARSQMSAVDAGAIDRIVMINTGKDYTNPTVTITGNPGYYQLGAWITTNTIATATAIVSPPRGHGRDLVNELFADKVCVSVDFIGNTHPSSNTTFTSSYKEYGLMSNPVFKSVTINVDKIQSTSNTYVGDILVQELTGAYGLIQSITTNATSSDIVLNNVIGVFEYGISAIGYNSKEKFIPIKPSTATTINTLQETFVISDIVDNSGEILLIRDDAVTIRQDGQTERIKLLVDF